MRDCDLQAPWVGLCREDYEEKMNGKPEIEGYCEECEEELYDGEIYELNGATLCENCYNEAKELTEDE